jgi:coatomer subunit gamma
MVLQAIKALCLKYPRKHRVLLNFLSHMLREEGGPEFKRAIVEALVTLIQQIDEAKEPGLLHLAEFIEDCEFTTLAVQVCTSAHVLMQARCTFVRCSDWCIFIAHITDG